MVTSLDHRMADISLNKRQKTKIRNRAKDLHSKFSYLYDAYMFWNEMPESKRFDPVHEYMIEQSKYSPQSVRTVAGFMTGSFGGVLDQLEELGLSEHLNTALVNQPQEYQFRNPIQMLANEEDELKFLSKYRSEMYDEASFYEYLGEYTVDDLYYVKRNLSEYANEYEDEIIRKSESGVRFDGGGDNEDNTDIKKPVAKLGAAACGAGAIAFNLLTSSNGVSIFIGAGMIFQSID